VTIPQQAVRPTAHGSVPDPEEQPVMAIPDVGWILFGLKPAASYKAAARGDFPVITSGRRKVVPTAKLRQMLGMDGGDRHVPAA
jgi:hypothetical protein